MRKAANFSLIWAILSLFWDPTTQHCGDGVGMAANPPPSGMWTPRYGTAVTVLLEASK